jgi:transcriptional regulator with XRE-family HTH domain
MTSSPQPQRNYSQEDVQQILNLALAERPNDGTMLSYVQLLEIAEELQIPASTLQLAEGQWLTQRGSIEKHQEFQAERRIKFYQKLGRYVVTNTFLLGLNLLTGFSVPWSLYVLLGWGLGMGLSAWNFYFHSRGEAYDRDFQKWQRKQKIQKSITGLIDKFV